ncbi:hypothetical protein [Spiroplasma endosymbiont of Polydrusus pterygomalis]|uniref:hypothetical protein n=1 Tax=Spiroplasma endosymbiont of Polydrusus pterygomalis TaxID=3139327 RepID=UPI003CCB0D6A
MTNLLSFNFFKTKSFKAISLALSLSLTGSLMAITNYQSSINTVNDSNKLSGFHITVKENNKNLINEANTWNLINNNYQDFIRIQKQLITAQFNDWSDIINEVNIKPNDDNLSKDVNKHFIEQIENKENHILPGNSEQYFTNIVGRSVAEQSFNGTVSFGNVYVNYYDDSLPAKISDGLFATINPKADFNNYFSIPYMIKPSAKFLKNHQSIQERVAILPLNNSNPNDTNQPMVVILAKKSSDEQLLITVGNKNVETINSNAVSYAILNHNPSDGLKATTFHISVKDNDYSKTINLTNNSSNLQFVTANAEHSAAVTTQYLIQNNQQTNQSTLVIMNKVADKAIININNQQQQWLKWRVDPQTLQKTKGDSGTSIKNGDVVSLSQESDFQVYCISLDTTDVERQAASEQYIVVYRNATKVPDFANCTDFFQNNKDNTLLRGFQQYLTSATNNSIKVEDLKNNAGEFLSWFIQYQGAITKQSYVNYLQSDNPDKPWDVNIPLSTRTVVNNWNVIIICGFIFSLLIIAPIVVVIIRKKKYLK